MNLQSNAARISFRFELIEALLILLFDRLIYADCTLWEFMGTRLGLRHLESVQLFEMGDSSRTSGTKRAFSPSKRLRSKLVLCF